MQTVIYHYRSPRDPVPLRSTLHFDHDIGLSRLLTGLCKSIGRGGENINNELIYKIKKCLYVMLFITCCVYFHYVSKDFKNIVGKLF